MRRIVLVAMTLALATIGVAPAYSSGGITKGPATFHHAVGDELTDAYVLDPRDAAVNSDGNMLVAQWAGALLLIAPDGRLIQRFDGPPQPFNVEVGPTGRWYVHNGHFRTPSIHIFEPDGTFLRSWNGSTTIGGAEFKDIADATVDANDRMVVSDHQLDLVQVINPDETLAALFGGTGTGPGEFLYPWALATDSKRNIYVVEPSGRMQVFTPTGEYLRETTLLDPSGAPVELRDIAFDSRDRLYGMHFDDQEILVYNSGGQLLSAWDAPDTGPFEFRSAVYLDLADDGLLYVIDNVADLVLAFTIHECDGRLATHVGTNGPDTIVGTAKADVIVGRNGNDLIKAKGGADRVCAGKGRDTVAAGAKADRVWGGGGNDTVNGGLGSDVIWGGTGADTLDGGVGVDTCNGGPGTDTAQTCEMVSGIP